MSDHDAELRVFDATDRLGRKIISWGWASGRRTISADENDEANRLIEEAENRVDPSDLDHATVLARIWMDGETVDRVEWVDRYEDSDGENE